MTKWKNCSKKRTKKKSNSCRYNVSMEDVEIQDNVREKELIELFGLKKSNHNRIGIDATIKIKNDDFHFEIKSSTMDNISTASPLHISHIEKWKTQHWIIGIYNKNAKLQYCVYASPSDMAPILDNWEQDIRRGLKISDMIVERIDLDMVYEVFGKKSFYTIEDAKFVFKKLYTPEQYKSMLSKNGKYSPAMMLKMFKEHNRVYLYRGAALNNPKILKKDWSKWKIIRTSHAKSIRKILRGHDD